MKKIPHCAGLSSLLLPAPTWAQMCSSLSNSGPHSSIKGRNFRGTAIQNNNKILHSLVFIIEIFYGKWEKRFRTAIHQASSELNLFLISSFMLFYFFLLAVPKYLKLPVSQITHTHTYKHTYTISDWPWAQKILHKSVYLSDVFLKLRHFTALCVKVSVKLR